ncbi:MAG: hypothetical protein KatS3mg008_0948 [Acidimicrobiales bacterium]|nr:MAG: hypothetical protein KatS3mg008_0948 [Acidimicrobiales bacterium]
MRRPWNTPCCCLCWSSGASPRHRRVPVRHGRSCGFDPGHGFGRDRRGRGQRLGRFEGLRRDAHRHGPAELRHRRRRSERRGGGYGGYGSERSDQYTDVHHLHDNDDQYHQYCPHLHFVDGANFLDHDHHGSPGHSHLAVRRLHPGARCSLEAGCASRRAGCLLRRCRSRRQGHRRGPSTFDEHRHQVVHHRRDRDLCRLLERPEALRPGHGDRDSRCEFSALGRRPDAGDPSTTELRRRR